VYGEGRVHENEADVPDAEQEEAKLVGVGMGSEHDAFVPPLEPLQVHVQLGELSALLTLVPASQP
jgi:hypothetical protein